MRLYIDPGTGSMLVTVLVGIAGAAVYSLRTKIMKMKLKLMSHHYTPIRMTRIQNTDSIKCWQEHGATGTLICC